MQGYGGVEELYMDSNVIGDEGAIAFANMLTSVGVSTTIKILSLESNRITDKGALALLAGLENAVHVQELKLASNPISPSILHHLHLKLEVHCCAKLEEYIQNRALGQGRP